MNDLEKRIEIIEKRNKKVEIDKAWETSIFRKVLIAILTYITIVIFFIFAQISNPFINAIVPTIWFVLSTLSLEFFKRIWMKDK